MKNKNKAIAASIVLLSLTSSLAYWEYSPKKESFVDKKVESIDTYTMYLNEFMEEFEDDLEDWDFEDIEEKIRWYKWDVEYLSQNKESEHYIHLWAYQTKLKALQDLKSRYTSAELSEEQEDAKEEIREKQKEIKEKREEVKKEMEEKKEELKEKQEEIKEEIEEKRKEAKEKLEEMKDSRKEMIKKHKEKYEGVLSQKLKTISEDHIKVVINRIDKTIIDIESTNMRENRKQNITAQLEAIKLILEERLSETEYKIDLDSLFAE